MPKSKHIRKHRNGVSKYAKTRERLSRGTTEQLHSAIDRAAQEQLPDRERGLYPKFQVRRVDGSSGRGGKHEKCDFIVLDLNHDPHAAPAIFSYATSLRADGYELLAGNLYAKIQPYLQQLEDRAVEGLATELEKQPAIEALTDDELREKVAGIWIQEAPASDEAILLDELLTRFEKLTAPKPKRTRKPKNADADIETKEKAA